MKLQSTKDTGGKWMRVILTGDSGVGKTQATATAPDPILRWNIRGEGDGEATLSDMDIATLQINSYDDLEMAYAATVTAIGGKYARSTEYDPPEVKCSIDVEETKALVAELKKLKPISLVVDSITALQNIFIEHAFYLNGGQYKDGRPTYGALGDMTRFWIERRFVALPMHIIFTALLKGTENPVTGQTFYSPAYRGNASSGIIDPAMSHILPIHKKVDEWAPEHNRWFQTEIGESMTAKMRKPISRKVPALIPADLKQVLAIHEIVKKESPND